MNAPEDLKYTRTHEWVRLEADGTATVGITDHAQHLLGDLVFVENPSTGRKLQAGEECAVLESVKAASDVYAPLSGDVVAINSDIEVAPEKINQDAYGAWMFKLKPDDAGQLGQLLDAAAYRQHVESESH